jgi:hypothetical protein
MSNKRQIIPIAGLLATIAIAIYFVVQLNAQGTGPSGNLTNAAVAEVRNAQGQVVLQGQFAQADEDDDDVERKAVLKPTGIDADAAGEAEVEFARTSPAVQEVEFSVSGVEVGSTLTFVIDGQEIGTATADRRGRAELEVDVRMQPAPQPSQASQ